MKIKVGDITLKQYHALCHHHFCDKCPLSPEDIDFACKAYFPRYDNDIVEIPDELLEANNES